MSAKRVASSELNQYNWDTDEAPDSAGTFPTASEDVLRKRVMRMAKRRAPADGDDSEDCEKKSAFGAFKGFSSFQPQNATTAFGFLQTKPTSNNAANPAIMNGIESKKLKLPFPPSDTKDEEDKNEEDDKTDFYAKLKGLNESVLSWIDQHVKENPYIDLSPVFLDYQRYLRDFETKNIAVADTSSAFSFKPPAKTTSTTSISGNKFQYGIPAASKPPEKTPPAVASLLNPPSASISSSTFVFGGLNPVRSTEGSEDRSKVFTWGSTTSSASSTTMSTSSLLSGTSMWAKPAPSAQPIASETEKADNDENEEDEPPKVEFTPVVETDHIYKVRCKVFVKKDADFRDRGVGNMYLKRVPDSQKVQLLVRADTNLGNLLCNFILSDGMPMQRMGKKDVMIVCIPTPDCKPPPVPLLLRVKTPEDAEALLAELEKHKK